MCLVVSSDRFAGLTGFWRQLVKNLSYSGLRMTLALGFDIVALRIAAFFAPALRLLGRRPALRTLREHARHADARYLVVEDVNSAATMEAFRQARPDLIVSFHFDQILRPAFLTAVAAPVVNIHPALLPAHRGPCPSFWVLAAGETHSGVTVHRIVDASIDSGEAVARHERLVPSRFSMAELDELLFEEGAHMLVDLVTAAHGPDVFDRSPESPTAPPSSYESFPDRRTVSAARRRGVRLWRLGHAVRLLLRMFGWRRA